MATNKQGEQETLSGDIISDGARKKDMKEIYLENIRLKERLGPNSAGEDVEKFTTTVLERLEQLRWEQEDIKIGIESRRKGKEWRTIAFTAVIILAIASIVAVIVVSTLSRNTSGSYDRLSEPLGKKLEVASPLLQALPVEQVIEESPDSISQKQQPLRKYYFNVGLRSDYLLQECQGPHLKRSFPDMDYALLGYNILKGYPLAVGHDPGFTLPIFTADYRAGSQTADCRYSVPKGIILIPDVSCITSFSSEVVETKYEFSKSLAVSASVSGGGWGISFSASAGYKESSSIVATGESVFVLSKAGCNYYYMRLLEDDAPPFHPVFLKWIKKLNNSDQETTYIEFFEKYGTHFLKEVKFGASFTYEHKMSASTYKTEKEKGVNVAVSASYSGLFSVGGGFSMDSSQREAASNFQKKVETRTITIGAAPPSNGDALTWASTVKESPVPVSYDLASIEELFTDTFIDSPQMRKFHIDYKNISKRIVDTKNKYCKVLKANGLVDSCADLAPGLTIKNTIILKGWFEKVALSSVGKCIDECFKRSNCIAIDFCVHCVSSDSSYNSCFMYDENATKSAKKDDDWESTIILPKIKKQMILHDTAVNGIERSLINGTKVTTTRQCYAACLNDLFCTAFTFCVCPDKDKQCTPYSDVHLTLFEERGTSTHFISRQVKDVNSVYTSTTSRTTTTSRATTITPLFSTTN